MDLGLNGRTAIVCGASSGLGLAVAEALAEEGAQVVMFARRRDVLEAEAQRIGGLAVAGDVRDPDDLERAVLTALETYGGIDILVPNSGGPPASKATKSTPRRSRSGRPAVGAVVRLVTLALPHLLESDQGRIVLSAPSPSVSRCRTLR
jgi:Short-chain alcohol dehydrogenase of unknown specificity